MTEAQIKHMVDRFLGWRFPEDFSPDAGISFKPTFNDHLPQPTLHEPTGTNLFDADQATAMVRYMVEGMTETSTPAPGVSEAAVKLVPRVPTPAMLEAAAHNLSADFGPEFVQPLGKFVAAAYEELVAAAPHMRARDGELLEALKPFAERLLRVVDKVLNCHTCQGGETQSHNVTFSLNYKEAQHLSQALTAIAEQGAKG